MFVVQECLKSRNVCIQEMFAINLYMQSRKNVQYRNDCSIDMFAVQEYAPFRNMYGWECVQFRKV